MAGWKNILCQELCDHIAQLLGTSQYEQSLLEMQIGGDIFNLESEVQWKLFTSTLQMTKFPHVIKLTGWVRECNTNNCLILQSKSASARVRPPSSSSPPLTAESPVRQKKVRMNLQSISVNVDHVRHIVRFTSIMSGFFV